MTSRQSRLVIVLATLVTTVCLSAISADEPANGAGHETRTAVEAGLRVLEKSARNYPTHRKCFACHSQTLPLVAMREAQQAGIAVDTKLAQTTAEFITRAFESRLELMKDGQGVPGKGLMLGYANVSLILAGRLVSTEQEQVDLVGDKLRDAMLRYLIKTQAADGHWKLGAKRPPMEESEVAAVVLAKWTLQIYSPRSAPELSQLTAPSIQLAEKWLKEAKLETSEDYVFRLSGMVLERASLEERKSLHTILLQRQREDGGWGQTADMASDAFATGEVLFALLADAEPIDSAPARRAVEYLLKTQAKDGSWFVKSRAKPVQEYFDNGDPYEKDQFISISATGWATAALAKTLPRKP